HKQKLRFRVLMQASLKQSPITIIDNAQFLTQDPQNSSAEAVAILGGKIIALDEAARQFGHAKSIDAGGAVIVPGFNDVHAHTVWFGQTLLEIDLAQETTPEGVYEAIAKSPKDETLNFTNAAEDWVIASGFNPNYLAGAKLDIQKLDEATGG